MNELSADEDMDKSLVACFFDFLCK